MLEALSDIFLLLLGWTLGLIGGPIAEGIARRYRRAKLWPALLSELRELQHTSVILTYSLSGFLGELNEELVAWTAKMIDSYEPSAQEASALTAYRTALATPVATQNQQLRKKDPSAARNVVRYSLPLLESHLTSLPDLPLESQRLLLAVREHVQFYNEHVGVQMANLERSFDSSITGVNRQALDGNIRLEYQQLARRARTIAETIPQKRDSAS